MPRIDFTQYDPALWEHGHCFSVDSDDQLVAERFTFDEWKRVDVVALKSLIVRKSEEIFHTHEKNPEALYNLERNLKGFSRWMRLSSATSCACLQLDEIVRRIEEKLAVTLVLKGGTVEVNKFALSAMSSRLREALVPTACFLNTKEPRTPTSLSMQSDSRNKVRPLHLWRRIRRLT